MTFPLLTTLLSTLFFGVSRPATAPLPFRKGNSTVGPRNCQYSRWEWAMFSSSVNGKDRGLAGSLGEFAFSSALQHLEHLIDRPFGQTVADADADDVVEPAVFLRRRLEGRRDSQIIVGGLDHFAAGDAVEHFLRAVAEAGIAHADNRVVVGLEHDAHVEEPGAVARPDRLPVAAAGQQRAAQTLALEAAAGDDTDAPVDAGRLADIDRRLHFKEQREDRPHLKLGHLLRQNFG